MSAKNNLEAIKLSKKKQPTSLKPAFLHDRVIELRFGLTHQPVASEQ